MSRGLTRGWLSHAFMPMRDTAIAGGCQMMEISDHEKLTWGLPRYDALWGYGGGPKLILRPAEDI